LLALNFQKECTILIEIENLSTVFNRTSIYNAIKEGEHKRMGTLLDPREGVDNVRNVVVFPNKKFKVFCSVFDPM